MPSEQPTDDLNGSHSRSNGNLFRREGEYWTIAYDGVVLRLRDSKGLRYLACLVGRPGERLSARALIEAAASKAGEHGSVDSANGNDVEPTTADHVSDEQARLAVTKRVKSAVRKIQEHDSGLGFHFSLTIKTGSHCVYLSDPTRPVLWTL